MLIAIIGGLCIGFCGCSGRNIELSSIITSDVQTPRDCIITKSESTKIISVVYYDENNQKRTIYDVNDIALIKEEIVNIKLQEKVPWYKKIDEYTKVELQAFNEEPITFGCTSDYIIVEDNYYAKNRIQEILAGLNYYIDTSDRDYILTEEEAERVTEIFFDFGDERYAITAKEDIEVITDEVLKVKLDEEKKIVREYPIEGGIEINFLLDNGEIIDFSTSGGMTIEFHGEYPVDSNFYEMVMNLIEN